MAAIKTSSPEKALHTFLAPFGSPAPGEAPWLQGLRRQGLDRFAALGIPTPQHEDWRFTPLGPLLRMPFRPLAGPGVKPLPPAALDGLIFSGIAGPRLVFVDGAYAPALSRRGTLPEGVKVESLATALRGDGEMLAARLAAAVSSREAPFAALNAAYFTDGVWIRVPEGVEVAEPIQLVFVTAAAEPGASAQWRNVVEVGRGASLTVLESYVSRTAAPHFTNVVTDVVAGEEAKVEHLRLQDEHPGAVHLATLHGDFGRSSRVWLHSVALGARLSRTNLWTHLGGEGLECVLNGLYLTRGDQLADHHMVVEHAQPHCASHEYFNGILDDRSRGVFHGRILVHPLAQKTDAKQTNKNILLSDEAQVDTKPQLEIYADDVKCTHGATVGQLNPDSIFYLRARGIGLDRARRMLIHAFAGEIIERVQSGPAREELDRVVWDRLEANPHIAAAPA